MKALEVKEDVQPQEISHFEKLLSVCILVYLTRRAHIYHQIPDYYTLAIWIFLAYIWYTGRYRVGQILHWVYHKAFDVFATLILRDEKVQKKTCETKMDILKFIDNNMSSYTNTFLILYTIALLISHYLSLRDGSGSGVSCSNENLGILEKYIMQHVHNAWEEFIAYIALRNTIGAIVAVPLQIIASSGTIILGTLTSLGNFFEDFGWIMSSFFYLLDRWIKSHLKKYENTMLVSWNIFVHNDPKKVNKNGRSQISLKLINEGALQLDQILNHDPLLLENVIDAARDSMENVFVVCENPEDQHNYMRSLITSVSQLLASSNWPVYAMHHVKDQTKTTENVLLISTCEKEGTKFTHTRAFLVFPSELKILLDYSLEEIWRDNEHPDCIFNVIAPTHRVRIVNLRRWAEIYFGADEINNKKMHDDKDDGAKAINEEKKKRMFTMEVTVPCQMTFNYKLNT